MKQYILPVTASLIILFMVYKEWVNDMQHEHFFQDVRGFINKGGRNTAEDGYNLCTRVNELLVHHNMHHGMSVQLIDCSARYGIDGDGITLEANPFYDADSDIHR